MASCKCVKCGYAFWLPEGAYPTSGEFVCDKCRFGENQEGKVTQIKTGCLYFGKNGVGRLIKCVVINSTTTKALLCCSMKTENKWNHYMVIEGYRTNDGSNLTWDREMCFYTKKQAEKAYVRLNDKK